MNKRKKFEKIVKKALKSITQEALSIYYASPLTFSETMRQMYGFTPGPWATEKKQLRGVLTRLQSQGWVEAKKVQDNIYYSLTKKGKVKSLLYKLKTQRQRRGEKSTIIIFDIPEEKRSFRGFLRRLLKDMKFTMIQKSSFITPNILSQDFYDLLKEMGLLKYIMVIEGQVRFQS